MSGPVISRSPETEKIRREIAALDGEIANARKNRDNLNRAIAARQLKRDRLSTQLVEASAPSGRGQVLHSSPCSG